MPIFTQRLSTHPGITIHQTLLLTAEERTRSRHRYEMQGGEIIYLQLPRGTILRHGDCLQSEEGTLVQVLAKPEPVLTVTGKTVLDLLRAAYHLGNRHVSLEITEKYVRLSPDPVLQAMLEQLGLEVVEEVLPFQPEAGAYGHSH